MKKMNFNNLDFYECPICDKKLFMYYSSVGSTGYGFNFFDCDSSRNCKRYAAYYRIVKNQRQAVKYYDSKNGDNVYDKQYKMVGVNNERK